MKRMAILLLVLLAALAVVWFAGPRVPVDTTLRFDPATIGDDPDAYLAAAEAKVAGIKAGQQKEIIWAFPASRAKTPLAIVYVHGFSASRGETAPLSDRIAAELGANLFYTRLTGHGRDGAAMAEASVNAWVNDYAEALAIGRMIGERVVVISVSTGSSIAVWAETSTELAGRADALVMISPNFGVQAAGAGLLTGPWGEELAKLIVGAERGFEPVNEKHATLWTTRYPTIATLPMAAVVDLAAKAPVERAKVPALFVFSDADKVVRPDLTRGIAARWGGPHEMIVVTDSADPANHVIAGDALSPNTTERLAEEIAAWIRKVLP